ncbi:hypothetical protein IWW50_002653 [Coemansia erecta]|nr:hypothetical protein IWW50_002653 [Coemansia erecta]
MANGDISVDPGFLSGCYLHQDPDRGASTLVSFHFVRYILFTVMLAIAGPLAFRLVAAFFDLERDFKTVGDHFDDLTNTLIYAFLVFVLGNYAHTFSWVTLVFYFVGMFGFCLLVELPFMRVSIPGWRAWSVGAWAVNLGGVALVVLAAGFHIKWAHDAGVLQWYLPLFVLATSSLWLTVGAQRLNNYCNAHCPQGLGIERRMRRCALTMLSWRKTTGNHVHLRNEAGQSNNFNGVLHATGTQSSPENGNESSPDPVDQPLRHQQHRRTTLSHEERRAEIEERLKNLHYLNVRPGRPLPLSRCQLHLHHWQIFYILAFFTRFDRFASSMCAGVVLGIVTQGSAAYGYDAMLERKPLN